jgi:hypothetical protein
LFAATSTFTLINAAARLLHFFEILMAGGEQEDAAIGASVSY